MKNSKLNPTLFPLSVIIPTLGGSSLLKTIELINKGTLIPDEILVCIPQEEASLISNYNVSNVSSVVTEFRGQVRQRAEGFKEAKHNYVMQLDDDVELEVDSIKTMVGALDQLGKGNVVGPSFYHLVTSVALHKFDFGVLGFLKSINASLFSSAAWGYKRMGKVTSLGIAFGVDPSLAKDNIQQVEWLPGGCVLSFKNDVIDENFFPLKGKAFSEDVVHSMLRKNKKIEHYVIIDAKAKMPADDEPFSINSFVTELKARLYVVNALDGNKLRFFIWCLSQLLLRVVDRK
jgi:glycosyltransferase involved in cell wall biosynthesis